MPLQIGYLDPNGHPRLKIRVTGTHPTAEATIEAMIDTGFTGFLMLPLVNALPLGLALFGTADFSLADDRVVTNFVAAGKVTVLHPESAPPEWVTESVEGAIVLGGGGALLGMEFIRKLDKLLLVGQGVMLIDNAEVLALAKRAAEAAEAGKGPMPPADTPGSPSKMDQSAKAVH